MAPAHAIDGPDAHDHATKQLAPELTIDGPQQDGYSYRVVNSKGKIVLQINKPQKSLAQIAGKSWKSANKWCGANSLTCTILTTVGFAAVKALL